jgi:hypothetical protein
LEVNLCWPCCGLAGSSWQRRRLEKHEVAVVVVEVSSWCRYMFKVSLSGRGGGVFILCLEC